MLQIFYILQRCSFLINVFQRNSFYVLLNTETLFSKNYLQILSLSNRRESRKEISSKDTSIFNVQSFSNDRCKSSSEYFVVESRKEREREKEGEKGGKKQRTSARLTTSKIHVGEIFGAKVSTYDHDWTTGFRFSRFLSIRCSRRSFFFHFFFFFFRFFLSLATRATRYKLVHASYEAARRLRWNPREIPRPITCGLQLRIN